MSLSKASLIGIDPGPSESGIALLGKDLQVLEASMMDNEKLIELLKGLSHVEVAVESIQSYGQIVGATVFSTCYMIGRIIQVCSDTGHTLALYPRPTYSRRLCGVGKVNDAVLRRALLMRFGGDKKGEPLNLLKGGPHKRDAFAVAVYHSDVIEESRKGRTGMCQSPP